MKPLDNYVNVHRANPDDTEILAVIHPPETITGTDDPDLVRRIRAALADPVGLGHDPRTGSYLPGPTGDYPPDSLEWVMVFVAALPYQGLDGEPIGYTFPDLPPIPPNATP